MDALQSRRPSCRLLELSGIGTQRTSDLSDIEKRNRLALAQADFPQPLAQVSKHHSIEVMDHEVLAFLGEISPEARILDIGGCWGWHWRKIGQVSQGPRIFLLDFVPENFRHARAILGHNYQKKVVALGGDAESLPFAAETFDGVWTVQTFQHIWNFTHACREAWRVLKPGGKFINYSLHAPLLLRVLYRIWGKKFHFEGEVPDRFYLRRADQEQKSIVEQIFQKPVRERFTECLFHPDLRFTRSGEEGSWLGALDSQLSAFPRLGFWIARQRSFFVVK